MGVSSGFPLGRTGKLRYVENLSLTSTVGVLHGHVFRANSIFDPDLTGVGHQPFMHDQMAVFYEHYTVVGAKMTIRWSDDGTVNTASTAVGIHLASSSIPAYANSATFKEAGKGTQRQYTGRQTTGLTTTSFFSCKKFFNIKDPLDNPAVKAPFQNNPAEGAYFVVYIQAMNASTVTLNAQVTIDYIVKYGEPKDISAS